MLRHQRRLGCLAMQAQIAASLRNLKQAAAHLSDAGLALAGADQKTSARIDDLLRGVRAEIGRLELLLFS